MALMRSASMVGIASKARIIPARAAPNEFAPAGSAVRCAGDNAMAAKMRDGYARRINLAALAVSVAVLGFAYYLQHVEFLDPCPWCIVQRLGFMAIGLLALVAFLHGPGRAGAQVYGVIGGLLGLAGASAAGYHLWLQSDPGRAGACVGSQVERALDALRVGELWPDFLQYDGPCTLDPWTLFGLGIPEWSFAWFATLSAMYFSVLVRPRR